MLSWLVYFVNWLVYKPNFQILFRAVLAKSRARPKMSLQKNLFTYFLSASTPHEKSAPAPPSLIIFHKKKHMTSWTNSPPGLPSFCVDGQSIIFGDICRSMADRVSMHQPGDTTFVIVFNVLRMFCLDLTQYPLVHHLLKAASIYRIDGRCDLFGGGCRS